MPASAAPSRFPPAATVYTPERLNDSTTCKIITIAIAQMSSEYVPAPKTCAKFVTSTTDVPGVVISCEWEMISVSPSRKNNIASVTTNEAMPM